MFRKFSHNATGACETQRPPPTKNHVSGTKQIRQRHVFGGIYVVGIVCIGVAFFVVVGIYFFMLELFCMGMLSFEPFELRLLFLLLFDWSFDVCCSAVDYLYCIVIVAVRGWILVVVSI